jgi:phage-related holin
MLIAIIALDTLIGLIDAKYQNEALSKDVAYKGFWKKLSYIMAAFFGMFIDSLLPTVISLGIGIQFNTHGTVGLFITTYIIINECISVSKHLHNISNGIIPDFVDDLFSKIANILNKGGKNDGQEGSN